MSTPPNGTAPPPRVTAAAGCGGWGPELARLGSLEQLDALLIGPVGHHPYSEGYTTPQDTAPGVQRQPPTEDMSAGPGELVPGGLVYRRAPVRSPQDVVSEVLPWLAARGLRAVVAVRGQGAGEVADVVRVLRRSIDFSAITAVEVDLCDLLEPTVTTPAEGDPRNQHPVLGADQEALRTISRAAEELPRSVGLHAKVPVLHPELVAIARSAIAGGCTALVAAGAVPVAPPRHRLTGPCTAPVTRAGIRTLRVAIAEGRLPAVHLIASGGVTDSQGATGCLGDGAWGVQLGSALFTDPHLLWEVTADLRGGPAPG